MSNISHRDFVAALRDWGVVVIEHEVRDRPWYENTSPGGWGPNGVCHHHTAGNRKLLTDRATQTAMRRILQHGRPGLDGPLAHLGLAYEPWNRRAVAHLCGWGNVNHAGMGDSRVIRQVIADTYKGMRGTREDHDGNPDLYGLEYMHPGDGTPWPDELIEVGVLAGAAICDAHGWKANSNIEHFEFTDRKVDRSCARLAPHVDIRADVARRLAAGPNGDDDMQLSDRFGIPATYEAAKACGDKGSVSLSTFYRRTYEWAFLAQRDAAAARALAETAAKAGRPLTAEETEAVVEKAIAENVVQVKVSVNGEDAA